jgi:type IV pilus assembly protein PilC
MMATAAKRTRKAEPEVKEYVFLWEGKNKAGKVVRGEQRANSQNVVRATLRRQGILVSKVTKQRFKGGRQITEKDITLFTRQLATMMKSGVPLLQTFEIVGRGHDNPSVGKLLLDIKSDVETGSSLSQAFRKHPLQFDQLYCNLVAAASKPVFSKRSSTAWRTTRRKCSPSSPRSRRHCSTRWRSSSSLSSSPR